MQNYYYSYYNGGIYTAKELKEFGYDEGGELIGKFKSREEAREYFMKKYGYEKI
jgi:hypothetical protein